MSAKANKAIGTVEALKPRHRNILSRVYHFFRHWLVENIDDQPVRASLLRVHAMRKVAVDTGFDRKQVILAFENQGVRAGLLGDVWWHAFERAAQTSQHESETAEAELIGLLKSGDLPKLEVKEWFDIYGFALIMGLYNVGYAITQSLLALPAEELKSTDAGLRHAVFSRKIDSMQLVKLWKGREKKEAEIASTLKFYELCDRKGALPEVRFTGRHKRFAKFIKGRSVAVVGPVQPNTPYATEIDARDVVVRLNYVTEQKGCDPVYKGIRTDVSYFNGASKNIIQNEHKGKLPADIKWGVFKTVFLLDKWVRLDKRSRNMSFYNHVLPYGSFNLVPYALLDLLQFSPASVKVYCSDLMISDKRYEGYVIQKNLKDNALAFLPHDPLAQFLLLERLRDMGKISTDSRLGEILDMGPAKYMATLQEIYGHALRLDYKAEA